MNFILALPLVARLLLLALAGGALGALVNWLVDRVRWERTFHSPWHASAGRPPRGPHHYLPVWGWLARRHESRHYGQHFWLRPLAIELLLIVALPALYWYEIAQLGLVAGWPGNVDPLMPALHAEYLSHVTLLALMLVASLVDLDEKIIPDAVTVPGTLLGLLLAVFVPASLLPEIVIDSDGGARLQIVTLASPHVWPPRLEGRPEACSLLLGWACLWLWCAGLMPRVWRARRGLRVAAAIFWRRINDRSTLYIGAMGLAGSVLVALIWSIAGIHWRALLTALVGMAITGGFTWLVRNVAGASIGREALGFGDVTLMSMIGAFLGWQAGVVVFFLAPFFGLVSGLLQWIMHRDPEIPYGPFLCLAASVVILRWPAVWDMGRQIFVLGWLIPLVLTAAVGLMGAILTLWHRIRGR